MNELDLNRIREDYPDHDQWCPIESQGICNCPKGVIDDLLRAVEQLTPIVYCISTEGIVLDMIDALDPDIKKLVENES